MRLLLRSTWLLLLGAFFFYSSSAYGQVMLTNSGTYTETFDGIGAGLPTGWTSFTNATATTLGTSVTFATAHASWNDASPAGFKNFSSADNGAASGNAATFTDRAFGLRQTSTFANSNAAFAVQLANTNGAQNLNLTFKLQSLDATNGPRTATWRVDYGFGSAPSAFTQATSSPASLTTGGNLFANQ